MSDLPPLNTLIYISLGDDVSYRSRVEDIDDGRLTVAAPIGKGDYEVPAEGSKLQVYWTGGRARFVLPVLMRGRTRERPPRWYLMAAGTPTRHTRRRFVRGGGGGPVTVVTTGDGPTSTYQGLVVDICEGGLRCNLHAPNLNAGDKVIVTVELADQALRIPGSVLSVRPTDRGDGCDVVVTYDLKESDAQRVRRYVFQWEIAERRRQMDREGASSAV